VTVPREEWLSATSMSSSLSNAKKEGGVGDSVDIQRKGGFEKGEGILMSQKGYTIPRVRGGGGGNALAEYE